jgi:hypothetical protein
MPESIPEPLKKYVDRSEPKELRLTAARGLIPFSPGELTHLLYLLTEDEDREIADEAKKSLSEIPGEVISTVLSDVNSPAQVLDYFGRTSLLESELEKIIVNNSSTDLTISYLAEHTDSQKLLELISNNHQRIVRSSEIVEALSKNPMVSRSTLDSVIDYLSLYLGEEADIPVRAHDISSGTKSEETQVKIKPGNSFLDSAEVDQELLRESTQEEDDVQEAERENILTEISNMMIGERIKLAIRGNREARSALIRDPNRIVSRAVLKNPRLTDTEIVLISQSKIVSEDILREISATRRWTKMYPVKLALVGNPKTPPHISVNLVRHLRDYDLRSIMWSKNLPGVITSAAKNIMHARRDGK